MIAVKLALKYNPITSRLSISLWDFQTGCIQYDMIQYDNELGNVIHINIWEILQVLYKSFRLGQLNPSVQIRVEGIKIKMELEHINLIRVDFEWPFKTSIFILSSVPHLSNRTYKSIILPPSFSSECQIIINRNIIEITNTYHNLLRLKPVYRQISTGHIDRHKLVLYGHRTILPICNVIHY